MSNIPKTFAPFSGTERLKSAIGFTNSGIGSIRIINQSVADKDYKYDSNEINIKEVKQ